MSAPPQKRIAESHAYLAEIVGSENFSGQRMQAGSILDLIDVVAGLAATRHAESPVVTLSFDRVDLVHPIVHLKLEVIIKSHVLKKEPEFDSGSFNRGIRSTLQVIQAHPP